MANVYWVRGRRVSFDRDAIHAYIEDNYAEHSIRLDSFEVQLEKGNYDYPEIVAGNCKVVKTYQLGRDGLPIHFKRPGLTIQAQI